LADSATIENARAFRHPAIDRIGHHLVGTVIQPLRE
jgi:hypothetical protein